MIITSELAQPMVNQMIKVIGYNINIMNQDGIIVASGDKDRINHVHKGALEAIEFNEEKITYGSTYQVINGIKSGINAPIELNGKVIGAVGISGDPNKIEKYIQMVKITVEALLRQFYLGEQLRFRQTALEEWVHSLINFNFNNINLLESKAESLNININTVCFMIVIEVNDLKEIINDYQKLYQNEIKISQLLNIAFPEALFAAFIGRGKFIIAVPSKKNYTVTIAQNIHQKLLAEGWNNSIGIGHAKKGIIGYRTSFDEATQSIIILKKVNPNKGVAHINEWGALYLFAQVPDGARESFLSQYRLPLQKELQETLNVYLENNMNIKSTSYTLHIHRNTLNYRLEKIKEILGLDPRNFEDAFKLQLLYWFYILRNT